MLALWDRFQGDRLPGQPGKFKDLKSFGGK